MNAYDDNPCDACDAEAGDIKLEVYVVPWDECTDCKRQLVLHVECFKRLSADEVLALYRKVAS